MFFLANAVFALILIGVIAAVGVFTPVYVNYLSHVLLAIFTETALGADDFVWPDDHWFDRWWKAGWCLAVLAVSAVVSMPFAMLFFLISVQAGLIALVIGVSVFFPISMLTGIYAPELLGPLHGQAYLAIFRRPGAWLIAWLWATPLAMATTVCFYFAATHSPNWAIGLGPLVPFAVVLFARAWGCFSWLATSGKRRKKSKASAEIAPSAASTTVDPWAMPQPPAEDEVPELDVEEWTDPHDEEPEDEWTPNKKPYAIGEEQPMANPKEVIQLEKHYAERRKVEKAFDVKTSRYERKAPTTGRAMGGRVPAIFKRNGVPATLAVLVVFSWIEFGLITAIIWLVRLV
ncbi:MAG: hypothetical protein U0744_01380 [Gemmataceae bacterium]